MDNVDIPVDPGTYVYYCPEENKLVMLFVVDEEDEDEFS